MQPIRSVACLLLTAAPAAAQLIDTLPDPPALSASAAHLALAPSLASGGGSASSNLFAAEVTLAGPAPAYVASSSLYRIEGGVVATGPGLAPSAPLLASVTPTIVRADGGEVVTLHGLALAPGGAAPLVTFAGVPSPSVTVGPAGSVTTLVPALRDAVGNPLGPVAVEVITGAGTARLADAVIAAPAYLQTSPARLGTSFTVTHHGQPGALAIPSWGAALPAGSIPIAGFGGAIVLFPIFQTAQSEVLDPSGVSSTSWPIPDLPQLVGLALDFQSVEITSLSPLVAGFTNAVRVVIEP